MLAGLFAHSVDLGQGFFHRFGSGDSAGDPDRKENRAEVALAHARNIDAAVGVARSEVEVIVKQALRGVVMRIDNDGRPMKLPGTLGNTIAGYDRGHK